MTSANQIQFLKDYMFVLDTTTEHDKREALGRMYMNFCLDHGYELTSDPIRVYKDLLDEVDNIDLAVANPEHPRSVVGDSTHPNRFFVTISPTFLQPSEEDPNCWEYETFEGATAKHTVSYGPFETVEDAQFMMDTIDLDPDDMVGSICIEDRMLGIVKEHTLHKVTKTVVEYVL